MTDTTELATLRPVGWTGPTGATVTRHLRFTAATDNRKGHGQTVATGVMEEIHWPPSEDGFTGVEIRIVQGLDLFKDGPAARFLIDDPDSGLTLYYVCTWHPEERTIGLKHMRRGMWDPESDGPKRLYHLRVTGSN